MKCFERVFYEILQEVDANFNEQVDPGTSVLTSILCYSKMHNFDSNYVYEGYIPLDLDDVKLHYYLSNKRMYFSIDKHDMSDNDIPRLQLLLFQYIQRFVHDYKLNNFVHGLHTSKLI